MVACSCQAHVSCRCLVDGRRNDVQRRVLALATLEYPESAPVGDKAEPVGGNAAGPLGGNEAEPVGGNDTGPRTAGNGTQVRSMRFQAVTTTPRAASSPICQIQRSSRRRAGVVPVSASHR